MSEKTIWQKLALKPGVSATCWNAPADFAGLPAENPPTPAGELSGWRLLFVRNRAEVAQWLPQALENFTEETILWIAYPKKSSQLASDLNRDDGWSALDERGLRAVSLVAMDETWSVFRVKRGTWQQPNADGQYAGKKAALRPIYEKLLAAGLALGEDVQTHIRTSYVALGRKHHFAVLQPTTTTRFELGLKLPGVPFGTRLTAAKNVGSGAISHCVVLQDVAEVDEEVLSWLVQAYQMAE